MRKSIMSWVRIAVVFASIMTASAAAHAGTDFRLLVLMDASGSMTLPSAAGDPLDPDFGTRFAAAKQTALSDIDTVRAQANTALGDTFKVAVFTFTCNTQPCSAGEPMVIRKSGTGNGVDAFVTQNEAIGVITGLSVANAVGGSTPLAGAMCSTVDTLTSAFADGTRRVLSVSSDGEENATVVAPCAQDPSVPFFTGLRPPTGYPDGTWQLRTVTHVNATTVTPLVSVLVVDFTPLTASTVLDPERGATSATRSLAPVRSAITALTPLEEFFTILAQGNGGTLHIIHASDPLPVPGDLNDDRCVDRADAIQVARQFGPLVPPADGRNDLNFDRTVDFTDYKFQVSRITSTCGPDPFVQRAPLRCRDAGRIVIDGQVIEDGGITIDVGGSCEITIKNSLIVAGKNAIKIVGSASLRIDNSIIVGQDAVIVQHGSGVISAANSVFHGKLDTNGEFQFIDRGGNTFE